MVCSYCVGQQWRAVANVCYELREASIEQLRDHQALCLGPSHARGQGWPAAGYLVVVQLFYVMLRALQLLDQRVLKVSSCEPGTLTGQERSCFLSCDPGGLSPCAVIYPPPPATTHTNCHISILL